MDVTNLLYYLQCKLCNNIIARKFMLYIPKFVMYLLFCVLYIQEPIRNRNIDVKRTQEIANNLGKITALRYSRPQYKGLEMIIKIFIRFFFI